MVAIPYPILSFSIIFMKNIRIFLPILLLLSIISCGKEEKNKVLELPETSTITFNNVEPLKVDLSGYRPNISGIILGENPLKSYSAFLEKKTGEVLIVTDFDLEEVLEYSFELEIDYSSQVTGLRIEVTDIYDNLSTKTININTEYIAAIEPQDISDKDAFPGAEGFGRYTTGGRGGKVLIVDNLEDNNDPGSLRWAIGQQGARTIIFKVSGNIELSTPLKVSYGDLTIAGHSAPGDGICVTSDYMQLVDGVDNVIIRYMRFRAAKGSGEYDAAWGRNCSNIIIDHCSFSWGNDEVASFYDNTSFTMQYCMVSESFYSSTHPKGLHGYGGIWGGMNASFHHNLIAHHTSRNPRFCGARFHEDTRDLEVVDFRNNVIYNWGSNSIYGGEMGKQNMVNNYFKSGPATSSSKKNRIVEISSYDSEWYIDGNYVEGYPSITEDNWSGGVQGASNTATKLISPLEFGTINTETAEQAYSNVLSNVGASKKRDDIDNRIINEVESGSATYGGVYGANTGIIDSQEDVGGLPQLESSNFITDYDYDGMDDNWELENGLSPNDAFDHDDYTLDANYTNLEVYLNSLL